MIKQTRLLAASLLASGLVACGPSERITATPEGGQIIERSGKVDIVVTDVTAQTHEDAVAEARATFDHFLTMQAAQLPGYGQFAAKVALPTRDGSKEHIWVNGIKRSKGAFSGDLNNDPYNLIHLFSRVSGGHSFFSMQRMYVTCVNGMLGIPQ